MGSWQRQFQSQIVRGFHPCIPGKPIQMRGQLDQKLGSAIMHGQSCPQNRSKHGLFCQLHYVRLAQWRLNRAGFVGQHFRNFKPHTLPHALQIHPKSRSISLPFDIAQLSEDLMRKTRRFTEVV